MRIWFAMLVAPLLVLADQGIAYATAGWSCARQNAIALNGVHALFLVAAIAGTIAAFTLWRQTLAGPRRDEAAERRHFLAGIAAASGLLSTLVIAVMWMPAWVLSPCYN